MTDILPVRVTQDELFIYAADLTLIARHALYPKGAGEKRTLPAHRPRLADRGPDLDQLRPVFASMHPDAEAFLAGLEAAQPRSAAHHARAVLALRERFATSVLGDALAHALRYGAFDHRAVERIVTQRAAPRRLEEYVAEATAKKLARLVKTSCTDPRPLDEYDALPSWSRPRPAEGETPSCPDPNPELPKTSSPDSESTCDASD